MTPNRNWLDAEPLILHRLRERFPDATVLPWKDVPDNMSLLPLPMVALRFVGFHVVPSDRPLPREARLRAEWHVIVAGREGTEHDPSGPASAQLSDLCGRVLGALLGYRPDGFPKPLMPIDTPAMFPEAGVESHACGFGLEFVAVAT